MPRRRAFQLTPNRTCEFCGFRWYASNRARKSYCPACGGTHRRPEPRSWLEHGSPAQRVRAYQIEAEGRREA